MLHGTISFNSQNDRIHLHTAAPQATKQEILTFTLLVQGHRALGDGAGFESMSSWVQGSCTVNTAIYSNFVLFVISNVPSKINVQMPQQQCAPLEFPL